jgi:hypothetical protein
LNLPATPARLAAVVGLAIATASGCATSNDKTAARPSAPNTARPLIVSPAQTPPLAVPNYHTTGSYPRVNDRGIDLDRVNTALRQAVLDDQHAYARIARRIEAKLPKRLQRQYPGTYKTSPAAGLISASSVVVSALIPLTRLFPAGNEGATWLSTTISVPTGMRIALADLFQPPAQRGLDALARGVARRLNPCVQTSISDPVLHGLYGRALAPRWNNYRYFALTPAGLTIGFPNATIAAPTCGRVQITVPYSALRPYLGQHGQRLIAGVRAPKQH